MYLDFLYHAWFSIYNFGTPDIILEPSAVKFSDRLRCKEVSIYDVPIYGQKNWLISEEPFPERLRSYSG